MVLPAPGTRHPPSSLFPAPEQQAVTAAWGASTLPHKHEASSSRGRTCVQCGRGKSSAPAPCCEKPPPRPPSYSSRHGAGQQHFKQGFP